MCLGPLARRLAKKKMLTKILDRRKIYFMFNTLFCQLSVPLFEVTIKILFTSYDNLHFQHSTMLVLRYATISQLLTKQSFESGLHVSDISKQIRILSH